MRARNASAWTGPTGNNTYLLRGRVPTLIDAGVGDPQHIEEIAAALDGVPLAQVLVTHGHSDHVGGLPALRERWPEVRTKTGTPPKMGTPKMGTLPISPKTGTPPVSVIDPAETGSVPVFAGDRELLAIHTPGHAPDHFCFFDRSTGDVYCGDLARAGGTIVIPATRGGNLRQYLESLQRIRDLRPRRLLPGHGPIVDDPDALIDRYIAHRAEREAQIVAAIRDRPVTAEDLVPGIYGRLNDRIAVAASESVLAHLIKLEEEGRARRSDDGRWHAL